VSVPIACEYAEKQECSFILIGIQNGTATLEDILTVSYRAKQNLHKHSSKYVPGWKTYTTTNNLHMNVYSSFIYNNQKWKIGKIPSKK
jgi:hypothetical protein